MPIIQDQAPVALPPGQPFPPGTEFTVRWVVHATGETQPVRTRYTLSAHNTLIFAPSGEKRVESSATIRSTATTVTQPLTLAVDTTGTPVGEVRITTELLTPEAGSETVLRTASVRVKL